MATAVGCARLAVQMQGAFMGSPAPHLRPGPSPYSAATPSYFSGGWVSLCLFPPLVSHATALVFGLPNWGAAAALLPLASVTGCCCLAPQSRLPHLLPRPRRRGACLGARRVGVSAPRCRPRIAPASQKDSRRLTLPR